MATKAKLSLSQLLFRRGNANNNTSNGYASGGNSNSSNSNTTGVGKSDQCSLSGVSGDYHNSFPSRKVSSSSSNFGTVSSGRSGFYEFSNPPEIISSKVDPPQQQLQGILKKSGKNEEIDANMAGKMGKSSLHRSRSNPNPSNNPLKEVSWSCPTLEKRREVILNYFERIILENKQEQHGKQRTKPNIPCDSATNGMADKESGGEPIYEEISDCRGYNYAGEKTGSLKPKVMPKKVRMNIPQDHHKNNNSGGSPIYDKLLCRSHSMLEPPLSTSIYDTTSSSTSSSSSTTSNQSFYENFRPSVDNDYGVAKAYRAGRSHSFHENFRSVPPPSTNTNYNIQVDHDTEQLYAKVCKRKKQKGGIDHRQQSPQLTYITDRDVEQDDLRVQVSCANVVTMIPVIMPCTSSFSTSCLSLSSSSDNNTDDVSPSRSNNYSYPHDHNEQEPYTEKILQDKDITYMKCDNRVGARSKNNLSVIHLLAAYDPSKEMEQFIPTPSFTAIIDSTECAPKSISVPVRGSPDVNNNSSHSPHAPLIVTNSGFAFSSENHNHQNVRRVLGDNSAHSLTVSDDDDEDDEDGSGEGKYELNCVKGFSGVSITQVDSNTTKDLLLLTSESEEEDFCETKSIMDTDIMNDSSGKFMTMDDEDRGFDSFLEDNDNNFLEKGDSSFKSDNLRNSRTFAQQQQGVPQDALKKKAASVLDLINSEISDLHMRELELKKFQGDEEPPKRKGGSDGNNTEEFEEGSSEDDFSDSAIEYDGFTTNESNSSGQVSPSEILNEMSHQDEPDQGPGMKNEEGRSGDIKVRPLLEEEDRSIRFNVSEETPIEREIRLTRDREEEFRRLNKLQSMVSTESLLDPVEKTPPKNEKIIQAQPVKPNNVPIRPGNSEKVADASKNKGQYEMATARFKKEIEENKEREKQLVLEGRLKKMEENDEEVGSPAVNEDAQNETKSVETSQTQIQEMPRKPVLAKLPLNKIPAARFFSPPAYNANKPNRITPVVSPIINRNSLTYPTGGASSSGTVGGSLPVGINRPSFTSLEKYILQSSFNYMNPVSPKSINEENSIRGIESMKPSQYVIPEDPLRIIQKVPKDDDDDEDKEEEDKPKRRYIPAQDKINKEIQDLAMREKELTSTRAKWKSTLDLPEAINDDNDTQPMAHSTLSLNISSSSSTSNIVTEEEPKETEIEVKKVGAMGKDDDDDDDEMKRVFKVKAPPRRRHSVLINQWEERIRQQQQLLNKK